MFCAGCGTSVPERARFCNNCGRAMEGGASAPPVATAGPATPAAMPAMAAAAAPAITVPHRRGNRLVVPRGAGGLPAFCVRCGAPSTKQIDKTFQWHSPWYYLVALVGVLFYVILAAFVLKRMRFGVPLCDAHNTRRRWLIALATLAIFGSIPLAIVVGVQLPENVGVWVGLVLGIFGFVGSVIWTQRELNIIDPKLIDEEKGEFAGVSEAFFRNLPVAQAAASGD